MLHLNKCHKRKYFFHFTTPEIMHYLHLDPEFSQRQPAIAYEYFLFTGGEPHIRIVQSQDLIEAVTITCRLNSFESLGKLLLATDALRRMWVKEIHVVIPYFPAARQDRVMTAGEPLSVKVYADLLNSQGYASVTIFDPHSEVAAAVLDKVIAVTNHAFVKACIGNQGDFLLVSPDGGALKKVYKLSEYLGGIEVVECSKKRDIRTGNLSLVQVYDKDLHGKPCYVVDDICDGGSTFIGLAEALKSHNPGPIYLVASHGIFSRGVDLVAEHFTHVYTTDSVRTLQHDKLTQISLAELLLPKQH